MGVQPLQDNMIHNVVVFCGSRDGNNPSYKQDAAKLGTLLGENGFDVVYGGGASGLMGAMAAAAVKAGAIVKSVITRAFREAAFYSPPPQGAAPEKVVETLNERVKEMYADAQAVVVLPGAIGTFDELWRCAAEKDMQICGNEGALLPPVIVVNTGGYYDDMRRQFERAAQEGFVHPGRERIIAFVDAPQQAIDKLKRINNEGGVWRALAVA